MKLLKDIEKSIKIIEHERGNFIFNQDGIATPKEAYQHFIIVHSFGPDSWYEKMVEEHGFDCLATKKTKKAIKSIEEQFKEDSDALTEKEIEEEENLAAGESEIKLSDEEKVRLIARTRKIVLNSDAQLNDNGWFLCPVYEGMDGLYPVLHKVLPKNKGFQLFISKVPLCKIPVETFDKENTGNWKHNSMFLIDRVLQNTGVFNMRTYSIFRQRRNDHVTSMLKKMVSQFDNSQRIRIKQGNILIDEVLTSIGQNAYISNKENLFKKATNSKADSDVDENELNKVKIIDEIMNAYKRINQIAEFMKKKVTEKNFPSIINTLREKEAEEEDYLVKEYIKEHSDELPDIEDMTEEELKDIHNKLHTLTASEYIDSITVYNSCKIYASYIEAEKIAEKSLSSILELHPYWTNIMKDDVGVGPLVAARIIADINFVNTDHPSSVIKYVGLDQVTVRPDRKDDCKMEPKDIHDNVCMLYKDWQIINANTKLEGMPELTEENYESKYKSDCLPTYKSYKIVSEIFSKEKPMKAEDMLMYPGFDQILAYMWKNLIIDERILPNGETDYVVRKRARKMSDKVVSSYIDGKGNVSFKGSLGYNNKLKSIICFLLPQNLIRSGNVFYRKIYDDYKLRRRQICIDLGIDPEGKGTKKHIHNMCTRKVAQEYLNSLWERIRLLEGLPLNGGSYYEGKVMGRHLHGLDPATFASFA